jgi:hypothetical protein
VKHINKTCHYQLQDRRSDANTTGIRKLTGIRNGILRIRRLFFLVKTTSCLSSGIDKYFLHAKKLFSKNRRGRSVYGQTSLMYFSNSAQQIISFSPCYCGCSYFLFPRSWRSLLQFSLLFNTRVSSR